MLLANNATDSGTACQGFVSVGLPECKLYAQIWHIIGMPRASETPPSIYSILQCYGRNLHVVILYWRNHIMPGAPLHFAEEVGKTYLL